jgi:hypothetical protein
MWPLLLLCHLLYVDLLLLLLLLLFIFHFLCFVGFVHCLVQFQAVCEEDKLYIVICQHAYIFFGGVYDALFLRKNLFAYLNYRLAIEKKKKDFYFLFSEWTNTELVGL